MAMLKWVKSSTCEAVSSVEVAYHEEEVIVRESNEPLRPALYFKPEAWCAFVAAVKRGEFDDLLT